jgi:O-antigen ligase
MKALRITRENIIMLAIGFVLSSLLAVLNLRTLGVKDTGMLFLATMILTTAVYLAFRNKKWSILLFVAGFPFLVTARKLVNFDFLIFKITYETIYITILFIFSVKDIKKFIVDTYFGSNRSKLNYILLTGVFLVFAINSSIFSPNIIRSLAYTYASVIVPIMFMLSIGANIKPKDVNDIYDSLIVMSTLSCLYGFFQIFSGGISFGSISARRHALTFGFHNVNIFAGILVLILPILIERFLSEKDKRRKFLLSGAFVVNIAALYITYTRGAWLAFLASMFVVGVVVLYKSKYKKAVWGIVVLALIGIKPVFSYIATRGTSTSLAANESTIARIQSLVTSIKIMIYHPFGSGAGNFAEMYKEYSIEGYTLIPLDIRSKMTVASYTLEAAHNLWLQIGTELGIVCAVVFLVIILNRLLVALRNFSFNRANIASLIAYLIFSVLTGVEFEHKGIITATLTIWLIFMMIEIRSRESVKNEKAY